MFFFWLCGKCGLCVVVELFDVIVCDCVEYVVVFVDGCCVVDFDVWMCGVVCVDELW